MKSNQGGIKSFPKIPQDLVTVGIWRARWRDESFWTTRVATSIIMLPTNRAGRVEVSKAMGKGENRRAGREHNPVCFRQD